MQRRMHVLTSIVISLSAAGVTPVYAGVTGNTFEGEVTLETPGSAIVPFDWLITFNSDGTVDLNASGDIQEGEFVEPIDTGVLSFYYAHMNTIYNSKFIGICVLSKVNILLWFTDDDGNSLDKGVLKVVPARKPAARSTSR